MDEDRGRAYWKANRRLILILLSIWAFVSLGCGILLVEPHCLIHMPVVV